MKKILIILLLLVMSGCQKIDEEALKEEIKNQVLEEVQFDPDLLNQHLIDVSSTIKTYTVSITVSINETTIIGSGILIHKEDNTYQVLTNEHVIRYASSIEVFIPSSNIYAAATVVNENSEYDLALLEFTTLTELSVYTIVDETYEIGEIVLSVGTSTSIDYANTVTMGIITRLDEDVIQHDAAINTGNSGGPLFNLNGTLIGINVSKINSTSVGSTTVFVEGMGFAIPLENVISFINE